MEYIHVELSSIAPLYPHYICFGGMAIFFYSPLLKSLHPNMNLVPDVGYVQVGVASFATYPNFMGLVFIKYKYDNIFFWIKCYI
jgi:hypothetical protein